MHVNPVLSVMRQDGAAGKRIVSSRATLLHASKRTRRIRRIRTSCTCMCRYLRCCSGALFAAFSRRRRAPTGSLRVHLPQAAKHGCCFHPSDTKAAPRVAAPRKRISVHFNCTFTIRIVRSGVRNREFGNWRLVSLLKANEPTVWRPPKPFVPIKFLSF